jgi:hypothetical protein
MRRLCGFVLIGCIATVAGILTTAVPAGAELTDNKIGCKGSAVVTDEDGETTSVDAEDTSATLAGNGSAAYEGSVATVTHDHFGEINLEVGPTSIEIGSWTSANKGNENSKRGTKELPSAIGDIPPGKYDVNGFHQGNEGRCAGHLTVEITGSILASPISAASVVLGVLALLAFLFGAFSGRPVLGALAGLFLGLFGGLDLVFAKVLSSSSVLLLVLPAALLVVGLVVGVLQRRGTTLGPPPTPA